MYDILKNNGFNVSVVQNPTLSPTADAAATKLVIRSQPSPVISVRHSYGGVVITETGIDPNVARLVYVTAFAPDAGGSVNALIAMRRLTSYKLRFGIAPMTRLKVKRANCGPIFEIPPAQVYRSAIGVEDDQ